MNIEIRTYPTFDSPGLTHLGDFKPSVDAFLQALEEHEIIPPYITCSGLIFCSHSGMMCNITINACLDLFNEESDQCQVQSVSSVKLRL